MTKKHMMNVTRCARWPCATFAVLLFAVLVCPTIECRKELVEVHRIVAIGDVHGDAENFLRLLRIADLIEDDYGGDTFDVLSNPPRWKFSQAPNASVKMWTTLVQMGDLIDRGEQDFESLNVAMSLQEQTQQSQTEDKVILLLGNHELLNLQGYYHYVNKKNYGGFLSKPLRVEGMQPSGAFGRYIIENFKTAHMDERTFFVHAGVESDMKIADADSLTSDVREALQQRNYRHRHLRSNGPMWTRKMIQDSMLDECDDVVQVLQSLSADRIVVGHTPQRAGQIEQYCDGRVLAIDTGISRWMYNKIAALEMVFLKHVDPDTQKSSTAHVIRELREGALGFSNTVKGARSTKTDTANRFHYAYDATEDGDL